MKRVCIVRQHVFPGQRNLRRSAETLRKEGYEVDVICLGDKGDRKNEIISGVNVYRIFSSYHRDKILWYLFDYTAFFILASLKLAWLSLKKRYNVVEVQTMPDFLVFVTLFPRLLGSKVILYMFDNIPALFSSSFKVSPNHIIIRLLRFIEKISASYAQSVIVSDGPAYKKVLESHGIPSEKISVVLNVPDDSICNSQNISRNRDGDYFRIIVAGTPIKRNGVQCLIKAIPLLSGDIPELRVDLTGWAEYSLKLEELAHDLNVEEYVNFTGPIPYEKVFSYIARAHIGVAPTIDDVGAPCKIFEYMALGIPTVASNLPGVRDVFDDKCVLYFQPGNERDLADRILELYHNPEKGASLVHHGHEFYCKYQWQIMKQEYLKVYKRYVQS
jgi:glycosyltransferase involved in cell wall biosynthesis